MGCVFLQNQCVPERMRVALKHRPAEKNRILFRLAKGGESTKAPVNLRLSLEETKGGMERFDSFGHSDM